MKNQAEIFKGIVFQNGATVFLARVRDSEGDYITQASVSSITYEVYDIDDSDEAVDSGTLTVADVVYDALQTDSRWTVDVTGYNFAAELDGDAFPKGNKDYQVEFLVTPASGNPFYIAYQVNSKYIFGA